MSCERIGMLQPDSVVIVLVTGAGMEYSHGDVCVRTVIESNVACAAWLESLKTLNFA